MMGTNSDARIVYCQVLCPAKSPWLSLSAALLSSDLGHTAWRRYRGICRMRTLFRHYQGGHAEDVSCSLSPKYDHKLPLCPPPDQMHSLSHNLPTSIPLAKHHQH